MDGYRELFFSWLRKPPWLRNHPPPWLQRDDPASADLVSCICLTHWPVRAAMLTEALRAYSLQKYRPRQLFVINDGLPLRSLADDVRVVNLTTNLTIGEKRNVGLSLAGRSWYATWDDDDFALPEHLSFLMEAVHQHRADYAFPRIYALANSTLQIGCILPRYAYQGCVIWAPTARRFGGYFPISAGEDVAMHYRLSTNTRWTKTDRLTYVYRRHAKNVTGNGNYGQREDRRIVDCLEDQTRWPRPEVEALQTYLDYCRATDTPQLVTDSISRV